MSRKLIVLFIFVLFAVAVLSVSTNARPYSADKGKISGRYNVKAQKYLFDGGSPATSSGDKSPGTTSLGAYSSQGAYPGYILGYSWRDDQQHLTAGHFTDWGVTGILHFVFGAQICNSDADICSRYYNYNYWNPTVSPGGVMAYGSGGQALQESPTVKGGVYVNIAVDEQGAAIVTGETFDATLGGLNEMRRVETYWDVAPYGNFVSDTLPGELVDTGDIDYKYPRIEYQQYGSNYVAHILSLGDVGACEGSRELMYWRKESADPRTSGTWVPTVINDSIWSNTWAMAAAPDGSGNFGIVYFKGYSNCDPLTGNEVYVMLSTDAGNSFGSPLNILPKDTSSEAWVPFTDISAMMDSDGYFHCVWTAGQSGAIDPARIYHWTNRVPGPVEGGTTSLVTVVDYDGLGSMCGRGQYNDLDIGKGVITECNGRLYTIWRQFGNLQTGDTLNCADDALIPFTGGGNASLYMSVSLSKNGTLWDAKRILTPQTTPDCDTTPGNECSNANYPAPARYGMNTASFGTTYWSNASQAFEVRDAIAPGYADDGYYVDVQYVDDLFPENARYIGDFWTYNPIKWFRLPCVDAVVAPAILISKADFQFPTYWVKAGEQEVVDILVENIGNDTLHVSSVTADYVQGPGTWLNINPSSSITVDPASNELVQVTINPGGAIDPAPGTAVALEAVLTFHNDVPNTDSAYTWDINTVVADTVIPLFWDSIATGTGMDLMLCNNGNAGYLGNREEGGKNLDFVGNSLTPDCDSTAGVYLYDLTPVIMLSADSGDYWWQPFWRPTNTHDFNFVPIPDENASKSATGTKFSQYRTGKFVNTDSSIAMIKHWIAPNNNGTYMIERMEVFSTAATFNDVKIGEWIDWDIPSDSGASNFGGHVANPGHTDYLYQEGYEFGEESCIDNSLRFGASGLLGWYYSSAYASDPNVNNTGLFGGAVQLDGDIFSGASDDTFIADSAWKALTTPGMTENNSDVDDQQTWLSFGSFTISPTDTLVIWVVHASIYNQDETFLQEVIDSAEAFYLANRDDVGTFGCCGAFTGGYSGNTDCSADGKLTLNDITKLIDRVFITHTTLCCEENGNVDGSSDGKMTLNDITKLIDAVFITHAATAPCL